MIKFLNLISAESKSFKALWKYILLFTVVCGDNSKLIFLYSRLDVGYLQQCEFLGMEDEAKLG